MHGIQKRFVFASELDVRILRRDAATHPEKAEFASPSGAPYGGAVDRVIGTGRATCRNCGKKIAKGEKALKWPLDIGGCGSWTCTDAQIHEAECVRGS